MAKKVYEGQTTKDLVYHTSSSYFIGSGNRELIKDIKGNNMIRFVFWVYSDGPEVDWREKKLQAERQFKRLLK